jgi:hypothetical protein
MSIGNDVVDLADPETRHEGLHPRFDERVFCPGERALLEGSHSHHVLRWALWAAKESAYKAMKRLEPRLVFSPKRFAVELSALPVAGGQGVAEGRVVHRGHALDVEVHVDGTCLHAVATGARAAGARLLWRVDRAASDPGTAVRCLAATAIGSALGFDPDEIQIAGRPPVALHRGRPLVTDVSLSHHGRFVAFAGALVHRRQVRRVSFRLQCPPDGTWRADRSTQPAGDPDRAVDRGPHRAHRDETEHPEEDRAFRPSHRP